MDLLFCQPLLRHRLLRGPARAQSPPSDLAALAGDLHAVDLRLLHFLDILWSSGIRRPQRPRVYNHLSRPHAGVHRLVVAPAQIGSYRQGAQDYIHCRFNLITLRQELRTWGAGNLNCPDRNNPLYRPAIAVSH